MMSRYRLHLSGPLPDTVTELIRSRFGDVVIRRSARTTELSGTVVDQPALRALLSLIWDTNNRLLSLVLDGDEQEPDPSPTTGDQGSDTVDRRDQTTCCLAVDPASTPGVLATGVVPRHPGPRDARP